MTVSPVPGSTPPTQVAGPQHERGQNDQRTSAPNETASVHSVHNRDSFRRYGDRVVILKCRRLEIGEAAIVHRHTADADQRRRVGDVAAVGGRGGGINVRTGFGLVRIVTVIALDQAAGVAQRITVHDGMAIGLLEVGVNQLSRQAVRAVTGVAEIFLIIREQMFVMNRGIAELVGQP